MINIHFESINYIAVLAVWIIHIVMSLVWFQQRLFGKAWSRLTGQELKPAKEWIVFGLLGHLLVVFVLAILIQITNSNSGISGLIIGLITWIGFIVPLEMGELVWEKIPFKLFLIRIGNHLIGMAVAGYILGVWQ